MAFKKTLTASAVLATLSLLSACGGGSSGGSSTSEPVTNSAPTDIQLSNSSVEENQAGATVGTLTAVDADSGDSHSFTTADARFVITGDSLALAPEQVFNFEATPTVDLTLTAADAAGETVTKTLTINVEDLLDTYAFASRFDGAQSSVSYSGQTARHVLIAELNDYIASQLQADLEAGTLTTREAVLDKLESFYSMDTETYDLVADTMAVTFVDAPKQAVMRDISSSHKNLSGKIAGNDATGQHKDWNNGDFAGWGTLGSTTPEGLVRIYFDLLADHAQAWLDGNVRQDPQGNDITSIYLAEDGRDLKQLIQKFLLMAVAYSQGADDYLDADLDGKGLLSTNTDNKDGKGYTSLEHTYDEGFGYFGAARDYLDYSDEELAQQGGRPEWQGLYDTDGDSLVDLKAEYNFGQAVNAAKRDLATLDNTTPTDFTTTAMTAFLQGRQIISDAPAELDESALADLKAQVTIAMAAWELSIVTTVVHYINDTHADLADLAADSEDFSYADLAKHWSEMKGFALGLQFNPAAPLTDAQFQQLHTLMQDAPVMDAAAIAAYQADLIAARDLLQQAYGLDAENVANW